LGACVARACVTVGANASFGGVVDLSVAIVVFAVADLGRGESLIATGAPTVLIGAALNTRTTFSDTRKRCGAGKARAFLAFVKTLTRCDSVFDIVDLAVAVVVCEIADLHAGDLIAKAERPQAVGFADLDACFAGALAGVVLACGVVCAAFVCPITRAFPS
jgi:hypothetical protein